MASLDGLAVALEEGLAPVLPRGGRVALLDFPAYPNPGDAAIWSGTLTLLDRRGIRLAYAATAEAYETTALRRALGTSPRILLQGGGNLGDLWPRRQQFRERVLREFPGASIVQLPQSIFFRDREARARAREVMSTHAGLRLFVRDALSLQRARDELGLEATLVPDMAFGLHPLAPAGKPSTDVLWLLREDQESALAASPSLGRGDRRLDWVGAHSRRSVQERMLRRAARLGLPGALGRSLRARVHQRHSARQTALAVRAISEARVVVTDRLHGHVVSALLQTPHVVLDTKFGKLRAFVDTWTRDLEGVHVAASVTEARDQASSVSRDRT